MMQRRVVWARGVCVLALALGMCVISACAWAGADESGDWNARAVQALRRMPDANALATAAFLDYEDNDLQASKRTFALLDRAEALDPAAPDLAALAMIMCHPRETFRGVRARARHLRALAPDNALGWLPALRDADASHQTRRVTDILQKMAGAGSFTVYRHALIGRFHAALERLPAPQIGVYHLDEENRRRMRAAIAADLLPVLDFRPLLHACSHTDSAHPRRREACQSVADALRQSDQIISVIIGLTLNRHIAETPQAYRSAMAESVRLHWLMHVLGSHCTIGPDPMTATCLAMDLARTGAMDYLQDFARKVGQPATPPAGWGTRYAAHWRRIDQRDGGAIQRHQKSAPPPRQEQPHTHAHAMAEPASRSGPSA